MDYGHPDRRARLDRLAAEYALGTLPRLARARLARAARTEPAVAQAIGDWEGRLASLAATVPGVAPPPRVWNGIMERLQFGAARAGATSPGLWQGLAFWRGLAAAGFAAAVAFAVALAVLRPGPSEPGIVAVLSGQDGRPALIASTQRNDAFLLVKAIAAAPVAAGRALELWMLPDGQPPRSLGLVQGAGVTRISLAAASERALAGVPALAVSLEPAGGSPTGAPTGPVLYSGRIERMY
jgi:anti-sigma-K factor RskA